VLERWLLRGGFLIAIVAMVVPLWSAHYLPFVDVPQHLHLIDVLGRLHDPSTLYPEVFKARGEITPYLGYYETVWLFARVLDVFHANALFLTLVAVATPLSVGLLSRSLGGSFWVGILACPFFYGDNLYWGFINYCASLPLLFLSMALFAFILAQPLLSGWWREAGLALLLIAVQLTHVQAFVFAGVALPLLLALTPSDRVRRLRAIAAVSPAVLLFVVWSVGRLGDQREIAPGEPWKAWGPILSPQNLQINPWRSNLNELTHLLANGFKDGSDAEVIAPLIALAGLTILLRLTYRSEGLPQPFIARLRAPLLAAVALAMFLFMPFDVRGYMYYVNYRFAELFALTLVAALPLPQRKTLPLFLVAPAAVVCVWYGALLTVHFQRFQREASPADAVIATVGSKPRIMALSYDVGSRVVSHPVYLHFASYAALAGGGMTSFSFAETPHSPLAYRDAPPPRPKSEWSADQFDYPAYGTYYDHYFVRGGLHPAQIFRGRQDEVRTAGQSASFTLYTRR
jgi:hypothetical protein